MKAHVVVEDDGALTLLTPYSPGFVADIKEEIPSWYRAYDPESKTWKVQAEYADQAYQLLDQHFEDVRRVYASAGTKAAPAPPNGGTSNHPAVRYCVEAVRKLYPNHSLLHVLPAAPEPVVLAAYRAMSKTLHPDVSGRDSTADQRALNAAYTALKTGA